MIGLVVAAIVHVALGYALVTGLAYEAVKKAVERVTTVDIEEPPPEEEPPPPPPDPDVPPPPPIVAPPPPINIAPAPPKIQAQPNIPPPRPVVPIAVPAPPAPPSKARAATPDGQARWQRRIIENYPARAIRQELEGTVGLSVSIDASGRVTGCRVTRSSGHDILDEAACTDYTRYARFNPALDDAGNPTSGSFAQSIRYQIN